MATQTVDKSAPGDSAHTPISRGPREWALALVRSRLFFGGVLLAALVAFFAIKLPGTFLASSNLKSVLEQQMTLVVLALGVTVVLMIGEFDLSFAATMALAGAVAVLMMTDHGWSALTAGALAVVLGLVVGSINGVVVAYGRAPAFIATLAAGSALTGIEQLLTSNKTIAEGIPIGYLDFTLVPHLGLPLSAWTGLLLVVVVAVVLAFTTYGRKVRATGLNATATALAGISVGKVRVSAFAALGALAGLAGVIVTSQAGSYFPGSGAGLLLPPYSAVFLGAAIVGRGRFSPLASVYGLAFIALLERGLTMLDEPAALIQLIEGAVLLSAVLLARREKAAG